MNFEYSEKDMSFFVETTQDFINANGEELRSIVGLEEFARFTEKVFVNLLNKMLEDEDNDIKINLARKLMFTGFSTMNSKIAQVMADSVFGDDKLCFRK
jgi:hypothetical protein